MTKRQRDNMTKRQHDKKQNDKKTKRKKDKKAKRQTDKKKKRQKDKDQKESLKLQRQGSFVLLQSFLLSCIADSGFGYNFHYGQFQIFVPVPTL